MKILEPLIRQLVSGVSPEDARDILEATCLSIASDGVIHPTERRVALQVARALLPDVAEDEVRRLVRDFINTEIGGAENPLAVVSQKLRTKSLLARRAALGLAALVQYVDGELEDGEEDSLNLLRKALGLELEDAQTVVDGVENGISATDQ